VAPVTPAKTDVPAIVVKNSGRRSVPALFWATLGFLAVSALAWFAYRAFWPTPRIENLRALPLTSYAGVVRSPSLSPDGSQVAFSWQREGGTDSDIYVQTAAGQNRCDSLIHLAKSLAQPGHPMVVGSLF